MCWWFCQSHYVVWQVQALSCVPSVASATNAYHLFEHKFILPYKFVLNLYVLHLPMELGVLEVVLCAMFSW